VKAAALTASAFILVALSPVAGSASRRLGAPRKVRPPAISGVTVLGRTLAAHRGTWAGRPTRFRYSWQRCNAHGRNCRAVRGAHGRTYRLGTKDVDSRLRVVVTASNAAGSASAASKSTRTIRAKAGAPPSGRVVMTEDLGWAPVAPAKLPWASINELTLFNLATQNGPALDKSNIENINVPRWVAMVHAHPGVKAIIAIGGAGNDNWGRACSDANRAQFVENLVGFATANRFDGIELDIEDGPWSAQGPPVAAMTTCIETISTATHSAGLFVSADVVTNWQGPWYAPSKAYVDQYNLMTYGDNLTTMKADVAATIRQGLPASKLVIGVDVSEHPQPSGGCGQFARYASHAGLMGAFVWEATSDARAGNACANGLAAG
jgi:hypothetical protein